MKDKKVDLLLDSGAFSAWNQGVHIDIDKYIDFCLEHEPYLDYIVNLDVIPASPGIKKISKSEIERSASEGWKNYEYMLKKGIPKEKLIHVFHMNEDYTWLQRMVKEIPYIGLSPANDRTTPEKQKWLDECMNYVCGANGMPLVKWHGFGVTSLRLMLRYPWYSVDSTSWVVTGRTGSVYIPRFRDDKYIYDEDSWKVCVSTRSPSKGEAGQHHIDTFSPRIKQILLDYIHDKGFVLGKSEFKMESDKYELKADEKWFGKAIGGEREVEIIIENGLSNDYKLRDELNIIYFLDLEKSMPKWPWAFKREVTAGNGFDL